MEKSQKSHIHLNNNFAIIPKQSINKWKVLIEIVYNILLDWTRNVFISDPILVTGPYTSFTSNVKVELLKLVVRLKTPVSSSKAVVT